MKPNTFVNRCILFSLVCGTMGISACDNNNTTQASSAEKPYGMVFPKGEKVTNDNFKGTVWLNYLAENDTTYNVNMGAVTFEPGARTNWHLHKGGQILLVIDGEGLYQERGKPIEIIRKGDVIKCPPDIEHWHGATSNHAMTHIAIGTNTNIGGAVWFKPVTDEEYNSVSKD